ncbi:recombinase family protein [Aerococcus viridans]
MSGYIYGYARVSTRSQELDRQIDLLNEQNCNEILTEKMTGTKASRPQLNRLKDKLRPGDTVIVESFSRLGRSTKDLIDLVNYFEEHEVKLVSLKENFDTSTPHGRLMMTVFQAFSQFERDLIVERTKEGLKSARARGRTGGRPRVNQKEIDRALKLYESQAYSVKDITEMTGISKATIYRYLNNKNK